MYTVHYSITFSDSLANLINYWQDELGFKDKQIKQFIQLIRQIIKNISYYPYVYRDVTELYGLKTTTYRALIGKQYAFFYRIDSINKIILVGALFSQQQMKIDF